jgi:glycerol-3-phosphate dehydrogenase subunit C
MREGSLEAPTRHPIAWQDPDFADPAKIEAELKRVFEICHGCRRCFNLCDSFPRLFDLIDSGASGEVDGVAPGDYGKVVEACTLCDLCFMTKCPYVPPHAFNVDFPHLMLRARAAGLGTERDGALARQMVETDRNGKLGAALSPLANWATSTGNHLTRPAMEKFAGIDRRAELPKFHGKTFVMRARDRAPKINRNAPAFGRKAAIRAGRSGARRRQCAARSLGVEAAHRARP